MLSLAPAHLGVTLLATVLGAFAFAIAYVDRLAERRAEVVGLQLLGAPRSVLRIGAGNGHAARGRLYISAIGLGRLVGDLYLMFGVARDATAPGAYLGPAWA